MVLDGDKHRLEGLGLWDLIASLSRSAYGREWDINNFENGWALMRCDCQEGKGRARAGEGKGEVVESRLSLYMAYLRLVHSIVVDNICIRLREVLKGGSNPFTLLLDARPSAAAVTSERSETPLSLLPLSNARKGSVFASRQTDPVGRSQLVSFCYVFVTCAYLPIQGESEANANRIITSKHNPLSGP